MSGSIRNINDEKTVLMIPTYNNVALLKKSLWYLDKLKPQPSKYIFFENNSNDDTLEVINNFNHEKELIRVWFTEDAIEKLGSPYAIMAIVRDMLLKRARQLNVDYAIFIDDDVFILSTDLISKLIATGKDIIGGSYLRRFPEGLFIASRWYNKGNDKYPYLLKTEGVGIEEVAMTSAGCLCLSQKAIQDTRLNFVPLMEGNVSEDFGYCLKASKLGYKVYVNCTLRIAHYIRNTNYKPWATINGKEYIKFEYGKGYGG